MSHKSKKCLIEQAHDIFDKLTCFGRSKHEDKIQAIREWERSDKSVPKWEYINSAIRDKIYSWNTFDTYSKHNEYFIRWVEENYSPKDRKTIEQIRQYVPEWLELRKEQVSPYTLKTEAAGLGKLYQCDIRDFGVELPRKNRADITRSRGIVKRDGSFSLDRNAEIINFCRGTGLRRSELSTLRGSQLIERNDGMCFLEIKGKGGRIRQAPIIGPHKDEIVARCRAAGDELVWDRVPSHMDVHSYRSDYATAIYKAYERVGDDLPIEDRYYCRGDKKGLLMDRRAMRQASEALGHSRIEIVAGHYIR